MPWTATKAPSEHEESGDRPIQHSPFSDMGMLKKREREGFYLGVRCESM